MVADHTKSKIAAIARIQERFNLTVSALANLIVQIMQDSEKIEDVASTLADNQKELAKRIEDESSSLEEMTATTKNVVQQSDENLKAAIETDQSSERAATKILELKQLIDDLGGHG